MGKTLIGFTDEEIRFTTSLIEFAKAKLQENHDASFSGTEQVIINSWLISTSELLTKFESRGVEHIEVITEEIPMPEA
jgi:hypothetical protein